MRDERLRGVWVAAMIGLASGCAAPEERGLPPIDATPGGDPWGDDDVSCTTTEDCGAGEICEGNVCQMGRCLEDYQSRAPFGANQYFGLDAELAVVSDASFIDGFEAASGAYLDSWDLGGETVVDVAGGAFDATRPQGIAVALEFSSTVRARLASGVVDLPVPVWPTALAAGDVDRDRLDELVVLAEDGHVALCRFDGSGCETAVIEGATGKDVAVVDVDADGFAEPVVLCDLEGQSSLVVWNTDAATTGQEESYGWTFNVVIRSFAGGDLDGDGRGEVVALEDGGYWGWADDRLHVIALEEGQIVGTVPITGHSLDVAVGDRDADGHAEVAILREDQRLQLFTSPAAGSLTSVLEADVTVGEQAQRLSMLDWDGDSASARLLAGPELVAGQVVPTVLLTFPPYPHRIATGAAGVETGSSDSTSESRSETVSLKLGLMVGYGVETPILEASVSASLEQEWSYTQSFDRWFNVGAYYSVTADPETYGSDYGAVVLTCGCYHHYSYQTEDPAGVLGGTGQNVELYLPVGGQTMLWSTKRYNAMAEALGTLPVIAVPARVGDPSSYPAEPRDLAGQPVAAEDLLFPELPSFQASEIGTVDFRLCAGQDETNQVAETTSVGVTGSFGVGGLSVELSAGASYSQGYSITVGSEAIFAGSIPPIPDDPATPEDEFAMHRYAFTPVVYRQRYADPAGEPTGFYVISYFLGP